MTRKVLNLQDYITIEHIESMNKVILVTGTIVGVAYLTELFISWYSQYPYEQFAFFNRALGPYWWSYFGMMFCNVVSPQFFWVRKWRRNVTLTFFLSIVVNIGMWFERFVIIATTLARDYLPSSWSFYVPTWVEIGIFLGTLGIFFTFYLIFVRVAPVVAIAEVKHILKSSGDQYSGEQADDRHDDEPEGEEEFVEAVVQDKATEELEDSGKAEKVSSTYTPVSRQEGVNQDKLSKIEGIGPKIESLLYDAGVNTWAELAEMPISKIKEILSAAGSRYSHHDPTTWSEQAKLAAEGKWDELKELQDKLDKGRAK